MLDIHHILTINKSIEIVFEAVSTPEGLNTWWTKSAIGNPNLGTKFQFHFEPNYNWVGLVTKYAYNQHIEWEMVLADIDWQGTKLGFRLENQNNLTLVYFYHFGWKTMNQHYCQTNFSWAMYLRLLKRHLEMGEYIPYIQRLDA